MHTVLASLPSPFGDDDAIASCETNAKGDFSKALVVFLIEVCDLVQGGRNRDMR